MKNGIFKFWFDISMAIVLCLLYSPHSTGLAFHEIAGLVLGGAVIIHVLFNKDWVIGISKKIFSKDLKMTTRFSYLLNIILFIDMFFIIFSGLLISKIVTPNFRIFTSVNWMPIHIFSSTLGLVIVGVHIGLHWNWIKQMGSRFPKLTKPFTFRKPSPKLVSLIILIVGSLVLLGQLSKMVSIAPAMFSNVATGYEQGKQSFGKHRDLPQDVADNQNSGNEQNQDFRKRDNSHGREETFSALQLAGNVPNLILYSSALAAMAYYTSFALRRPKKRL